MVTPKPARTGAERSEGAAPPVLSRRDYESFKELQSQLADLHSEIEEYERLLHLVEVESFQELPAAQAQCLDAAVTPTTGTLPSSSAHGHHDPA